MAWYGFSFALKCGDQDIQVQKYYMVDETVIRFENVSKRFVFRKIDSNSKRDVLRSLLPIRQSKEENKDLWAVRNVNFELSSGQALGIIGRNGSGKSTLLKLVAKILRPTEGRMMINGRTSALLELGAGFHPDLTGRENIFLNASVLGLSKKEILARFDDIVTFSELDEFINVPVKYYSSGMYMRLGFSVAVHVEPDILIVDEILAVGDQAFQTKCLDRIFDMKRRGTTIIMVSHHLEMMRKLCTRLIWLENGKVRESGDTESVAGNYAASAYELEERQLSNKNKSLDFIHTGSKEIEIINVRFLNENGEERVNFKTGDAMTIEVNYLSHEPIPEPSFGFAIHRQDGIHIAGPNNILGGLDTGTVDGEGKILYHIDKLPLLPARYIVTAVIYDNRFNQPYDYHDSAYSFRVVPGGTKERFGLIELPAFWEWLPGGNDKNH